MWCTSFTSWWGDGGLSPATSPSQAMVWDCFHFPLVALPEPPRYTLPNSSLDSCLTWTSNVVQASLAVPPLKNMCLRCNQTAAASRPGGSVPWFPCKRCHSGEQDSLQPGQSFFCGHLWGWILDQTQVTLRDVDLNHWSSSCLHNHVKSLGVSDLGQG